PIETQQLLVGPAHTRASLSAAHHEAEQLWNLWTQEAAFLVSALYIERLLPDGATLPQMNLDGLLQALGQLHEGLHAFWQAAETVLSHLKTDSTIAPAHRTWSMLCDDLRVAQQIVSDASWLDCHAQTLATSLGDRYRG